MARDLLDVRMLLQSDVDTDLLSYSILLEDWPSDSLSFKLNFSDPLLVSDSPEEDQL